MRVPRLLAALVIVALLGSAGMLSGDAGKTQQAFSPTPSETTTTTEPDFDAIVASGVATTPFAEEEEDLTEEALSRASSTTTSTTTTTLPPTTTTTKAQTATSTDGTAPTSTTAAPPPPDPGGGYHSGAEKEFASRINSHRANNGLPALTRNGDLNSFARGWAKTMGESGSLSHSNIGSLLGPWSAVAENIGMGGSVSSIFQALAGSGGHNSNMLGDYTHMGIGVWEDANGTLWTAHVFAR